MVAPSFPILRYRRSRSAERRSHIPFTLLTRSWPRPATLAGGLPWAEEVRLPPNPEIEVQP